MNAHRLLLSAMLIWSMAACSQGAADNTNPSRRLTPETVQLNMDGDIPSLDGAIAWLNSPPLSKADLRGKVVLVDFWTYTCVNWRRTLPYVRAWADKYRNQGLIIIGVHTPEFDFEKDLDNVRQATTEMEIHYRDLQITSKE
jgi:thiol-disulfide isomerase/thioredoxin